MTVREKGAGRGRGRSREVDDLFERLESEVLLKVGVQGSEASAAHEGSEETVVDVASSHEFGIGVPRRSFLRDWFDQSKGDFEAKLKRAGEEILKGRDVHEVMETMGLVLVGDMQERISNRIPPPNSASTIDAKGSDVPLIDTGQLRSSITHKVEVE